MILTLTAIVGLVGCGKEPVGDPPTVNEQDYFNASVTQVNDNFPISIESILYLLEKFLH